MIIRRSRSRKIFHASAYIFHRGWPRIGGAAFSEASRVYPERYGLADFFHPVLKGFRPVRIRPRPVRQRMTTMMAKGSSASRSGEICVGVSWA